VYRIYCKTICELEAICRTVILVFCNSMTHCVHDVKRKLVFLLSECGACILHGMLSILIIKYR
jgi:hypothetical protein